MVPCPHCARSVTKQPRPARVPRTVRYLDWMAWSLRAAAGRTGQDGPMAALKDQLRADLTAAIKARDDVRTRTIRSALTAVSTAEVAGRASRELSDDEVVTVLTKEAKRRREAADAFAAAGRTEQASAERAEGEILATYLPAQLGDDETAAVVTFQIDLPQ